MSTIPEWFWEAVDQKPASHYTEIDDIDLHYLSWNEAGGRGLLFIHGHNAHAHWWDFIAPAFCDQYHPIAMDMRVWVTRIIGSRTRQGSTLTKLSR